MRWLPQTLGARLIVLILLAVALSQGVSLLVYRVERLRTVRHAVQEECLGRAVSAFRVAEATPEAERAAVLATVETPLTRYWLTPGPPGPGWADAARAHLLRPVPGARRTALTESLFSEERTLRTPPAAQWQQIPESAWLPQHPVRLLELPEWNGFGFAMELAEGEWLNTVYAKPDRLVRTTLTPGYYVTLALTILIFLLAALFIARRLSRPLRQLTRAAERFGYGEEPVQLVPEGPADIRATMEAFNRMQARLHRLVEDRTRMLAAIGHDLRTPITSLRLRAEFVADEEAREKLIATLDEMQAMTEAALSFARAEAVAEPGRVVDLSALLQSLCDDLADLGWAVAYEPSPRLPYPCRADALRRAVRNVVENAIRYGQHAQVALHREGGKVCITVRDAGPGIPEGEQEHLFAPFVRGETSRNTSTGGVGLGLTIARSILRGHGGEVTLRNLPGGGLEASLVLPGEELAH